MRAPSSPWIGLVGLVVALWIAGALRAASRSDVEDLRPRPDALEYEEGARNLLAGEGYSLIVNGATYPPRYPPGFSLLLVPVLAVADRGPGSGVVVVQACALLTIVATFLLGRGAAGPLAGTVAAVLVAVSPGHVVWSRAVMSDVPAACMVTWILFGTTIVGARGTPSRWALLGLATGLACLLRMTNLAAAIPALVAAMRSPRDPAKAVLALATGLVLGLVPLLAYDLLRFGSPLRTGYDAWTPGAFFAWRYVLGQPAGGGREPNLPFYVQALMGLGDLYSWPIAVLVLVGAALGLSSAGRARQLVILVAALLVPLLGAQLAFFWQGTRFLLPLVPALLCVAAVPLGSAAPRWLRVAAAVLVVFGIAQLMARAELYRPAPRYGEPSALATFDALVPPDAALLLHTSEPMFRRFLRRPGTDRLWVRLAADPHQLTVKMNRLVPESGPAAPPDWIQPVVTSETAVARVGELLDTGRPVYLSTLLVHKDKSFPKLVDVLARSFERELVARTDDGAELYALRRRGAQTR